jgi:hypothetical protein
MNTKTVAIAAMQSKAITFLREAAIVHMLLEFYQSRRRGRCNNNDARLCH